MSSGSSGSSGTGTSSVDDAATAVADAPSFFRQAAMANPEIAALAQHMAPLLEEGIHALMIEKLRLDRDAEKCNYQPGSPATIARSQFIPLIWLGRWLRSHNPATTTTAASVGVGSSEVVTTTTVQTAAMAVDQ